MRKYPDHKTTTPLPPLRGVSVMEDARFSCQGSGLCCGGYAYGPIDDAVAARIEAHRFSENAALIHGPKGPFDTGEIDGQPMRVLRLVNGRCVFLSADNLCVLHKELGADAKPALCRIYPLNVTLAPDGIAYISLNMECGGFAEGCKGPLLADQLEDELAVVLSLPSQVVSSQVTLVPGQTVDYETYIESVEWAWLDAVEVDTRAPAAVVKDLAATLWSTPTDPDAAAAWPIPHALLALVEAHCARTVAEELADGNLVDVALNEQVQAAAHHLRTTDGAAPQPGTRPGDAADALMRTQLRNVVFGKAMHRSPSLAAGLGLETLKLTLSAQLMETRSDDGPLTAQHVNEALRTVNRCIRQSTLPVIGEDAAAACVALSRG